MSLIKQLPFRAKKVLMVLRRTLAIPDVADQAAVLEFVRADIEFRGAKSWILILAVLVASLGLNTNSTAVIIGAMLISPLMGPIIGLGTALGVADVPMFWKSVRHLSTAIALSLVASSIYFFISPFDQAASELLARTTPTLLDALIAISGGAAGAIAMVRLDRSNVVPGVAIATALMPPLCTAGYAIAQFNIEYFIGAFYLFFINSVYIAASTYAVVRLLKFDHVADVDPVRSKKHRQIAWVVVLLTMVPSVYTGWNMLRRQAFEVAVSRLKQQAEDRFVNTSFVVSRADWNSDTSTVIMSIVGDELMPTDLATVREMAQKLGLDDARLELRQSNIRGLLASQGLLGKSGAPSLMDLYHVTVDEMKRKDSLLAIALERPAFSEDQQLLREAQAIEPLIREVDRVDSVVYIVSTRRLNTTQMTTIQRWLQAHLETESVVVKQVVE